MASTRGITDPGFLRGTTRILLAVVHPWRSLDATPGVTPAPPSLTTKTIGIGADLGITTVEVYVWDHPAPDAIVLGDAARAILVLTTGLIDLLDTHALQAAITHELAHAAAQHPRRFTKVTLAVTAGLAGLILIPIRARTIRGLFALIGGLVGLLVLLALARRYEHDADRRAADHLDDPRDLARALLVVRTGDPDADPETYAAAPASPFRRLLDYAPPLKTRLTALAPDD